MVALQQGNAANRILSRLHAADFGNLAPFLEAVSCPLGLVLVDQDDASIGAGEYVVLAVSDTGVGMAPEVASRALEPFFTTKPVGRGTGLGLSQLAGFARRAGGLTFIETAPSLGTRVTVFLPRDGADVQKALG